jgi:transposase-like protein
MEVMERDERKRPRARRSFTTEFKAEIVEQSWTSQSATLARPRTSRAAGWSCWLVGRVLGA